MVLGIETSCDETAVALVDGGRRVLAETLFSQLERHAPFGGVVPEIAARAHVEILDRLIAQHHARSRASRFPQLAAVAATAGPGPDRRPDRRPDDGARDRLGAPPAAARDQPSGGPCADRAADRRRRFPLPSAAGLGRPLPAPGGRGRSGATGGSARRSTTRWARRSTRPPRCWGWAFRAGRRSSRRRGRDRRATICRARCGASRAATSRSPGSRRRCARRSSGWAREPRAAAAERSLRELSGGGRRHPGRSDGARGRALSHRASGRRHAGGGGRRRRERAICAAGSRSWPRASRCAWSCRRRGFAPTTA